MTWPIPIVVALAGLFVVVLRLRFEGHARRLETAVREAGESSLSPRTDLPPEVLALAQRLGARPAAGAVSFEQSGEMWQAPGGKAMPFTARQAVNVQSPAFVWRAAMGPGRLMIVLDYLADGTGGLEASGLGVIPIARLTGGGMTRGEALRYLAELPWNPDAILSNRALDWTVVGPRTLRVATGNGDDRAEITFELDGHGLVEKASAASRLYADKGALVPHPWHGRFWDYQPVAGRLLPRRGEVAWDLDGREFVYWRGRVETWEPAPRRMASRTSG